MRDGIQTEYTLNYLLNDYGRFKYFLGRNTSMIAINRYGRLIQFAKFPWSRNRSGNFTTFNRKYGRG